MKILILNWRDIKHEWAGGSEVYIFELAKRWVKMGHKVTLFCGEDIRLKRPQFEVIDGISVYRKGRQYSLYFWAFWSYITKLRKECDIIVDVQNGIPFFSVLYSAKPKVAVVYHVHGKQFFVELPFPLSFIGFCIERFIFPLFYKFTPIIAISKTTVEHLEKLGFKSRIDIVYCGIETKKQQKSVAKFTQPTILYLGRIKKYKRVDLLIKLMPRILKKVPNARLLVAGWGTEGGILVDSSMRSDMRKKIKIIGPVSDVEKKYLLSKAWVFVNLSIGEGWSIAVIEANLYNTPSVAFRVNGLSESIKNNKTGFLADTEDEIVEKIITILKDEKTRTTLSRNANEWAKTFSWDRAAKDSIKILEREIN
jgi:glycosyltransferase involved in cell wall biosynthesis